MQKTNIGRPYKAPGTKKLDGGKQISAIIDKDARQALELLQEHLGLSCTKTLERALVIYAKKEGLV